MEKVAVTFKLPAFGHLVIEAHSAHSSSITQSIIRSVNREMWTDWNVNVCKEGWDRGENFRSWGITGGSFCYCPLNQPPPPTHTHTHTHIQVTSPTFLVIKISQYRKRKKKHQQHQEQQHNKNGCDIHTAVWLWGMYGGKTKRGRKSGVFQEEDTKTLRPNKAIANMSTDDGTREVNKRFWWRARTGLWNFLKKFWQQPYEVAVLSVKYVKSVVSEAFQSLFSHNTEIVIHLQKQSRWKLHNCVIDYAVTRHKWSQGGSEVTSLLCRSASAMFCETLTI